MTQWIPAESSVICVRAGCNRSELGCQNSSKQVGFIAPNNRPLDDDRALHFLYFYVSIYSTYIHLYVFFQRFWYLFDYFLTTHTAKRKKVFRLLISGSWSHYGTRWRAFSVCDLSSIWCLVFILKIYHTATCWLMPHVVWTTKISGVQRFHNIITFGWNVTSCLIDWYTPLSCWGVLRC